jgi:hypothetical protein
MLMLVQHEGRDREIHLSGKYRGYKKELYGDAVQALYTELK